MDQAWGWDTHWADSDDGDVCIECNVPLLNEEYCFLLERREDHPLAFCLDCAFNWWVDQDLATSPVPAVLIDPERNPWTTTRT